MNRHERKRQKALNSSEVLEAIPKLRQILAIMRQNKDLLPPTGQMPDGQVVDVLDGETDRLLDEIEALATIRRSMN